MMIRPRVPTVLALLVAAFSHSSHQRVDVFSKDTSLKAGFYRSSEKKVSLVKSHFEQIRASRFQPNIEYNERRLALLDEIYQLSEVRKDNCEPKHFQQIQRLIEKKAKFDFSSVPLLKYHFWLQFVACQDELGRALVEIYDTKLSETQRDDLRLLYDKTTSVRSYAYRLLLDDLSGKEEKLLISVLLDGSAAFMRFRGAHIWEILAKHDKDNQFTKEHMEIVQNFCLAVDEPLRELMDIFNEVIVDRETLWSLSLGPRPTRVFFLVKICQRIIEHEEEIVHSAHKQLAKRDSHLERWLFACGRRRASRAKFPGYSSA